MFCRVDDVSQRSLLECQQQQGADRGADGHTWNWVYYPNGTVIQYFPQSQKCTVQAYAEYKQVFFNWTGSLVPLKQARVRGVDSTIYHAPDIESEGLSGSLQYLVSQDGVPNR